MDVTAADVYGAFALHQELPADSVQLLIDAGASVHALNVHGHTPLHVAVQRPSKAGEAANASVVMRMLLKAGANVRAVDRDGRTPLHYARDAGVATVLLDAGASVLAVDKAGDTVLHTQQAAEAVRVLVAAGADARAVNAHGGTIVHAAIARGAVPAAVAAMVAAGADIDAADHSGATALDTAIFAVPFHKGSLVRVRCLLDLGANPAAGIGSGGPALQVVQAKVAARMQRLAGRASQLGFGRCGGQLLRMLSRCMAWTRRRHMLLAIGGRLGAPVPSSAGSSAASAATGGAGTA